MKRAYAEVPDRFACPHLDWRKNGSDKGGPRRRCLSCGKCEAGDAPSRRGLYGMPRYVEGHHPDIRRDQRTHFDISEEADRLLRLLGDSYDPDYYLRVETTLSSPLADVARGNWRSL